ncbi:hypothetical protein [Paraburkholderia tropica]|uniref:hypothetical protein n=1 Tax=Paraburkholderia tropica TaxID=92647 RepID=UPI002AB22662|nr:hypothetical protein [Paraburkholderia tropica]
MKILVIAAMLVVSMVPVNAVAVETWEQSNAHWAKEHGVPKNGAPVPAATCQAWEQGVREETREAEIVEQQIDSSPTQPQKVLVQWRKQADKNRQNAARLTAEIKARCND